MNQVAGESELPKPRGSACSQAPSPACKTHPKLNSNLNGDIQATAENGERVQGSARNSASTRSSFKKSLHRHSLIGALGFLFLLLQNVSFYLFAFLTMALLRYSSYIIYLFEVFKSVIFGVLHY